ncbi:Eukaryotic aspartyl protease [Aphelenchoides fujianensis]|nr:Eukaryotic aspartyl protease [Aphelenchoides fujianensis]
MRLLLFFFVGFVFTSGFELVGRQNRRTAAEIRAYHRQQVQALGHKNYLINYPDEAVIVEIKIGTPPQMFNVSVETSTDYLWVFDDFYPARRLQQPFYNYTKSSTSLYANCCWTGWSDNFEITGAGFFDTISFFSLDWERNAVNQSFSTAQVFYRDQQLILPTFEFDGVLGLAWSNAIDTPPPLFGILRSIPHLHTNYSVVWLEKPTSADSKPTASITFGYPNDNCDSEFRALTLVFVSTPANPLPAIVVDAFEFGDYSYTIAGTATLNLGQPVVLFPFGSPVHLLVFVSRIDQTTVDASRPFVRSLQQKNYALTFVAVGEQLDSALLYGCPPT